MNFVVKVNLKRQSLRPIEVTQSCIVDAKAGGWGRWESKSYGQSDAKCAVLDMDGFIKQAPSVKIFWHKISNTKALAPETVG